MSQFIQSINGANYGTCHACCDCDAPVITFKCACIAGHHAGFFAYDGSGDIYLTQKSTVTLNKVYPAAILIGCVTNPVVETDAMNGFWQAKFPGDGTLGVPTCAPSSTVNVTVTFAPACPANNCSNTMAACNASGLSDLQNDCGFDCRANSTCVNFGCGYTLFSSTTCPALSPVGGATATAETFNIIGCVGDTATYTGSTVAFALSSPWTFVDFTDAIVAQADAAMASSSDCSGASPCGINGTTNAAWLNLEPADHNTGDINCFDYLEFGESQFTVTLGAHTGTISWNENLFDLFGTPISVTPKTGNIGTTYTTAFTIGDSNGFKTVSDITVTACSP